MFLFCFFKQKTAYEMRISDWSSDVCSSDLATCRRIDAGIVDQDVDRIAAFAHPHCEGRDAGRIGEIERLGMQARRAAAVLLQLLDDALRPGKIEIGNRDVVAKAMKLRDASPAQTAGTASDDDMLFFHAGMIRNVSYT